jgi:hypothetical protein
MGELLLDEAGCTGSGGKWSVERRFRVTEVFLAVLWVWVSSYLLLGSSCVLWKLSKLQEEGESGEGFGELRDRKLIWLLFYSAAHLHTSLSSSRTALCPAG